MEIDSNKLTIVSDIRKHSGLRLRTFRPMLHQFWHFFMAVQYKITEVPFLHLVQLDLSFKFFCAGIVEVDTSLMQVIS